MPIGPANLRAREPAPWRVRSSIERQTAGGGKACKLPSRRTGPSPQRREAEPERRPKEPANLPDESAAILELPAVNPGLLRRDAPKDGSPGDVQVRIGSAEAVGDVVAFQAQLELDAFLDREHLGQRHVHVDKTRPLHVVVL